MELALLGSGIQIFHTPNFFLHDLKTFWTWGALVVALLAAFSASVRQTKSIILKLQKAKSEIHLPSFYYSSSDDVDDDASCSSSSDNEDEDDFEDDYESDSLNDFEEIQEQNCEFEWPEIGSKVVKEWTGCNDIKAIHVTTSPALVLTAEDGSYGNLAVKLWDARSGSTEMATNATWREGKVVGIAGREGRVYVRDDDGYLSVVDLRNGAVISNGEESFVSWCRNVCLTLLPESG